MTTYPVRVGTLAYYDSLSGLVPVRVTEIQRDEFGLRFASIATGNCGPWSRGMSLPDARATRIVPRPAIRKHRYSTTILPYVWQAESCASAQVI